MRLINNFILIIILNSCNNFEPSTQINGSEICQLINVIHQESPFKIETLSNKCYIQDELYISGRKTSINETPFSYPKDTFMCGDLSIVLLENRKRFEYNGYMYYIELSIRDLSEDGQKIIVSRFTDELFQRPNAGIGIEFDITENFFMTRKNNIWVIDSLVQDEKF